MEQIRTIEDVRHQIEKACEIYKLYPIPHPAKIHSSIKYCDILPKEKENKFYLRPTPQEIDDADVVQFYWLPLVNVTDRQLVWKRFSGMGWKRVAKEANISERTARNRVNAALETIYKNIIN